MSFEQLKIGAAELPEAQRRELVAYLVAIGRTRNAAYWEKLESKIEDRDPANWARGEDLDRVLGFDHGNE